MTEKLGTCVGVHIYLAWLMQDFYSSSLLNFLHQLFHVLKDTTIFCWNDYY